MKQIFVLLLLFNMLISTTAMADEVNCQLDTNTEVQAKSQSDLNVFLQPQVENQKDATGEFYERTREQEAALQHSDIVSDLSSNVTFITFERNYNKHETKQIRNMPLLWRTVPALGHLTPLLES